MRKIFCEPLGTEISIPDVPKRIISFSPAVTQTLFQIGLGDSVVGVSAFCVRPQEARSKTKVGSYNTADPAFLKKLEPDLIFTVTGYQREFALKLGKEFPVYAVELPVTVTGILDIIVKIGLVAGAFEEARKLASSLLKTLGGIHSLKRELRVYVEIDFTAPVSFGAYSYITDALSILGAKSIFSDEPSEWLTPDFSVVLRRDPDVILYEAKMFRHFTFQDLTQLIEKRRWMPMRAVQLGNVFLTPGPLDFLAHHGPSFITEGMLWLSEKLSQAEKTVS